jgi:hypothetical protein
MLTICTWLWGDKYDLSYVEKLYAGVGRHLKQPFRFLCMTERDRIANFLSGIERYAIDDLDLTKIKGCFARLRLFDLAWQQNRGIDGPILSLDLDVIVTGALDPIVDRPETFVILQGANAANPCPYNGSVFMLRPGYHSGVFTEFNLNAIKTIPKYEFADDQGWFWHKMPHAAGWRVGGGSGIYGFQKPGWPNGTDLPNDARLVAFIGWRDPSKFMHLDWVKEHWIA